MKTFLATCEWCRLLKQCKAVEVDIDWDNGTWECVATCLCADCLPRRGDGIAVTWNKGLTGIVEHVGKQQVD